MDTFINVGLFLSILFVAYLLGKQKSYDKGYDKGFSSGYDSGYDDGSINTLKFISKIKKEDEL